MPSLRNGFIRLLFVLAATVCSWPAHGAYQFTSIDQNPFFTEALGINDSGHVVGVGLVSFVYDAKRGVFATVPDDPDFLASSVFGINDAGVMAGTVLSTGFTESGFVRDKKGIYTVFSMPGWDNTEVRGINSSGLVVGYAFDDAFTKTVGFIYDPARNAFVDFLPSPYTLVQGINARGDAVGHVTLSAGTACTGCPAGRYGFLRAASGAVTYFQVNDQTTVARGISNSGLIVGAIRDPVTFNDRGFVVSLRRSGASFQSIAVPGTDLLEFPGADSTTPEGITSSGDVIGIWIDTSGTFHGFIATPSK